MEAIEGHVAAEDAIGDARTRLCLGEWLAMAFAWTPGANHHALEAFDRVDAAPWVERARSELRASGERLRRREENRDELTPQDYRSHSRSRSPA